MHVSERPSEMPSEFSPLFARAVSAVPPAMAPALSGPAYPRFGEVAPDNADKQAAVLLRGRALATQFLQKRHISPLRLSEGPARVLQTKSACRDISFSTMSVAAGVAFLISCQPTAKRQIGKCKLRA